MNRRKYRLPPPPPLTTLPSPAEIIELEPRGGRPPGTPVTPLPGSPAPEIIAAEPMPRLWLRVALSLPSGSDPARVALAAATFASAVMGIDRRLRMSVDPGKSGATGNELVLVFVLGRWGSLEAEWVEEAKPAVRELASNFEGAEFRSVEVVAERRP